MHWSDCNSNSSLFCNANWVEKSALSVSIRLCKWANRCKFPKSLSSTCRHSFTLCNCSVDVCLSGQSALRQLICQCVILLTLIALGDLLRQIQFWQVTARCVHQQQGYCGGLPFLHVWQITLKQTHTHTHTHTQRNWCRIAQYISHHLENSSERRKTCNHP